MSERKVYLGDSVYADFDGWMICLTTENGMGPSNTIYLEPEVMLSLIQYAESLRSRKLSPPPHATGDEKCHRCGHPEHLHDPEQGCSGDALDCPCFTFKRVPPPHDGEGGK